MADKDVRLKIVYVEDDASLGSEVKQLLENEGHEVCEVVASGADAMRSVREHDPDIVLMDIMLKGSMDGIEATKKIHTFSEAPVIFISGYKSPDMMKAAADDRNTIFLTKPLDPAKIVAAIRALGGL